MNTYLLTWNPRSNNNDGDDWLMCAIGALEHSVTVTDQWSSGNRRNILPHDRVYLLRQGPDQPGIVGSGLVSKGVFSGRHWDDEKRRRKIEANYVRVDWETLVPIREVLARSRLLRGILLKRLVDTQCSGTALDAPSAIRLKKAWEKHVASPRRTSTLQSHQSFDPATGKWKTDDSFDDLSDVDNAHLGSDGAPRGTWVISGVRRNPSVRRAVRKRSGRVCERLDCGTSRNYAGFIDVHHILGAEKGDRVWNCVGLCPNCHRETHFAPNREKINRQLLRFAAQFKASR